MATQPASTHFDPLELPDPLTRVEDEQQGYLARGQQQFRSMTRDREAQSVLLALAAGFGIGMLVGGALSPPHHRRWRDRHTAERLGHRFLQKLDQHLPESVTRRLGS